jgi:catechol 2,3-dioxygenase
MRVQALGHAVIKVRDLRRAEEFYCGVLGMTLAARHPTMPMTFITLGNHHDLALLEVGADAPEAPRKAPGLFHLAFKVGDSVDELRQVKAELEQAGVKVNAAIDHTVSQALYLDDPDGNGVELYVDGPDVWKQDPERVTDGVPLEL